jgi:miniconductance mechanosensitive channel
MAVIAQKTKTKFDDLSVSNKKRLKYIAHLIPLFICKRSTLLSDMNIGKAF